MYLAQSKENTVCKFFSRLTRSIRTGNIQGYLKTGFKTTTGGLSFVRAVVVCPIQEESEGLPNP